MGTGKIKKSLYPLSNWAKKAGLLWQPGMVRRHAFGADT
jgi:hypothetical protein